MTGRLTKRGRAKKRENEKADKALGGAQLKNKDERSHPHVELQWFRLLRGQSRLNQIARILVELAPASVFDPKTIYSEQINEQKSIDATKLSESRGSNKKKGKKGKKAPKLSKKEMIILANKAKKQKEAAARDAEKLKSLGTTAAAGKIKLKTQSGKFLLLNQILKKAVKANNVVDCLDTLWEIESIAKEISIDNAKSILKDNAAYINEASKMRKEIKDLIPKPLLKSLGFKPKNLAEFQLTAMSDRLPPLNLHALKGKFKLDPWQMEVLTLIENKTSVVVTAPTSCGKTVLSTFVCGRGDRTLFVVPTEPLAWQVAAMLRALKLGVALVVPTLSYVPNAFQVAVGTPQALESCLTKQIGFDFTYAVYDEVHSLNTEGGEALQRLIKLMPSNCQNLALSATIGNATELLGWWKTVLSDTNEIKLVQHKARFINLQRHIWSFQETDSFADLASNKKVRGELRHLHPALSLSVDFLSSDDFNHNDLAFTPVDTYKLFKSMDSLLGDEHSDILKNLKPRKYFPNEVNERITLEKAKEYEDSLKKSLQQLAKRDGLVCKKVLCSLAPEGNLKDVQNLVSAEEVNDYFKKHVYETISASKSSNSVFSLASLVLELSKRELLPGILFQLDSVQCQGYFDKLLSTLEDLEAHKYPSYHKDLLVKEAQQKKNREISLKVNSIKNKEDDDAPGDDFVSQVYVDTSAPHPDFCLSPVGRAIGAQEERNLKATLQYDLQLSKNLDEASHPLIRGLRRGIGLYIGGLPASYHRIVQSYAQSGRLGLVLSDELLAYGVNMPFRSAIFFDDPGAHWLTPLVHQQMAGRAGRRGLDRQGHLIYAGFTFDRLQELLRGELPDILGKFPLYPTIPLQLQMSEKYEVKGISLNQTSMKKMCTIPLKQALKKETVNDLIVADDYYETAEAWMEYLGLASSTTSSYGELIPELVWELRLFLPESLALQYMIEHIITEFKDTPVQQTDADVKEQETIALIFSLICSRKKAFYFVKDRSSVEALDNSVLESLYDLNELNEQCSKFIGVLGNNVHDQENWANWKRLLVESQERILKSKLKYKLNLLLPVDSKEDVCNMCHSAFQRNQIDPRLPTPLQHELRQRLWALGEVLRITYNVLGRSKEINGVTNLVRKTFVRIRYILDETSERNWASV